MFVNVAENASSIIIQSLPLCQIAGSTNTHTHSDSAYIMNCDLISLLNWKFKNDANRNSTA